LNLSSNGLFMRIEPDLHLPNIWGEGAIFAFYDSKDIQPLVDCDRKGGCAKPYNIRVKYDAICDFHWSAALTARLLFDFMQ